MKRRLVCRAMSGLGITAGLLGLRRVVGVRWITVLTYHRVGPGPSVGQVDDAVVTVEADAFERQLKTLKEGYDVIDIEHVADALRGGRRLPPAPVLLTFDDGYRDNHDVALPILKRQGVRATFFVATKFVDERRLFWWDRVNYLLKRSERERVELRYPHALTLPLGPRRGASIRAALRVIKERFDLDVELFLAHLSEAAGVPFDERRERALAEEHVMTWKQVRALHDAGMSVQSHTHSHRVLQTLPARALDTELAVSRALLEAATGTRVSALAYPVGRAVGCAPEIRTAVRRAGYEIAFSNRAGVNSPASFDTFDARRITVDTTMDDAQFRAVMAVPALAH